MEWKEVLLSEFLEFNPKRTIKKNEVARKITMDLLIPHSKQIYSFKYEPYTGGAKFSNGDTIMARITPCLENGKHAYVSCLNEGEIAYGSTEYIVLCGKNGVSDNEFVYYLSHTPQFVNTAIKSMVGSSGRQRAQVPVLENLIMPVPVNLSDQRKIAGI
ncbi:MAG TPA: restriction endonuclease subunit S, partial [Porphyromonadaceae bacterium]|nr:restriction endonuclease subunit S [Porphyromonadaceae bacterium]